MMRCWYVVDEPHGHGFMLVEVRANTPGYVDLGIMYAARGPAENHAAMHNEDLGLTAKAVASIVASSMKAQNEFERDLKAQR